jgi:hypothetical protein
MKTYSEEKGETPFNWFEFLSQEYISPSDWENARNRSSEWVTCACGNQCAIIPRESDGEPIDPILKMLGGGSGFHDAIIAKDSEKALEFLITIEERSKYLIKKEIKKIPQKLDELAKEKVAIDLKMNELIQLMNSYD